VRLAYPMWPTKYVQKGGVFTKFAVNSNHKVMDTFWRGPYG